MLIIIMGVSGSGKSTYGKLLSENLKIPFYDADDYHPKANLDKMKRGIALNDKDRMPWLHILADQLENWQKNEGAILSCSALKESYRRILISNFRDVIWIYLSGTFELIRSRIEKRKDHFMSPDLLRSQFETLEIPVYGMHININQSEKMLVKEILTQLKNDE